MKKILFTFLSLSILITATGQGADTSKRKIPASWKKYHPAPRVAFGTQRAFFLEAGLAFQKYTYAWNGFVVNNFYSSFEWTPANNKYRGTTGVKVGFENVFNGGAGGIEVKYLSDGDSSDVMITPRIGWGIGAANLFYGYNLSTNKYPFDRIRKHQFTLVINTNILFYIKKYEKK